MQLAKGASYALSVGSPDHPVHSRAGVCYRRRAPAQSKTSSTKNGAFMSTLTETLDTVLSSRSSAIARDLKLNLSRLLDGGALDSQEALLAVYATATSLEYAELATFARTQLQAFDLTAEQLAEASESAAIMA